MRGYRYGITCSQLYPVPEEIRRTKEHVCSLNQLYARIGPVVPDLCPLAPDRKHKESIWHGVNNRSLRKLPDPDKKTLRRFKKSYRTTFKAMIRSTGKLRPEIAPVVIDDKEWPGWKKTFYRLCYQIKPSTIRAWIGTFVKAEFYLLPKPFRFIFGRNKNFCAQWATYVAQAESLLYEHKFPQLHTPFLKKHKVQDRPRIISDTGALFAHDTWYVTDYSKYENSHTAMMKGQAENWLFKQLFYMTPTLKKILDLNLRKPLVDAGIKRVNMPGRMSGDMHTSFGNSTCNYALVNFFMKTLRLKFVCFVEGDDCLFKPERPLTSDEKQRMKLMAENLGFLLTIDGEGKAGECGFCSTFWTSDLKPLVDPTKFIMTLGWTTQHRKVSEGLAKQLLKAKLLSYYHATPDCPIVGPLCYNLLKQMKKVNARTLYNMYEAYEFQNAGAEVLFHKGWMYIKDFNIREPEISDEARCMIYRKTGIPPDAQKIIETETTLEQFPDLTYLYVGKELRLTSEILLCY